MKKNTKKSTTNKLVNPAVKRSKTTKKLANTAAMKKKAAKTRNAFRRALYRANKLIDNEHSLFKNRLTMKEFKKEFADFGKRTGMLKGKNLDKDLKTFIDNAVSDTTPKQRASAVANLMKHLNDAVRALNRSKDINNLDNTLNRYIQVLIENNALKTKTNKNGKKSYSIIKEKVPNEEDLLAVNNKYLKFKRSLITYFGDQEYAEAYGS